MPSANHSLLASPARSRIWFLTLCAVLATMLSACGQAASAQSLAPVSQVEQPRPGADARKAAEIKLSERSTAVVPFSTPTLTATETPDPTETPEATKVATPTKIADKIAEPTELPQATEVVSTTHDQNDDHGTDGATHDQNDDHGTDGATHDQNDDHGTDGGNGGGNHGGDNHGGGKGR
jgi:hypothetical protein